MKQKPTFEYNKETGEATCILSDGVNTFIGSAKCHPTDMDMANEMSGCFIAENRALIKYFQHIKNNEIKPKLSALYQLYYSMNRSKFFDKSSYQSKMLFRQINQLENDLTIINNSISSLRENIKEYVNEKDNLYKKLRAKKSGAN